LNILVTAGLLIGLCLLFSVPYIFAWFIYRKGEKILRAHASEVSSLGINTQEICRRLLDNVGLYNVIICQSPRKFSYFDLKRSSIFLSPRLYGKDTISAIAESTILYGKTYCLSRPTWAHRISRKVLSNILFAVVFLSLILYFKADRLTYEAQIFIVVLLFALLAFWCSIFLRQLWLESSSGFEQLKQVLSDIEFNTKLYKNFIFKPYRIGVAWSISLFWSVIILMP
jgi:Zn-dependent membrane protease YugP